MKMKTFFIVKQFCPQYNYSFSNNTVDKLFTFREPKQDLGLTNKTNKQQ